MKQYEVHKNADYNKQEYIYREIEKMKWFSFCDDYIATSTLNLVLLITHRRQRSFLWLRFISPDVSGWCCLTPSDWQGDEFYCSLRHSYDDVLPEVTFWTRNIIASLSHKYIAVLLNLISSYSRDKSITLWRGVMKVVFMDENTYIDYHH